MKDYTKNTEQIVITDAIKDTANGFKEKNLDLILEILNWIFNNFENIERQTEKKAELFRKRTADEIIQSKQLTGCSDYAIVFIALCRAKEVSTKYVEAIRRRWLDIGDESHIEGHVFAECLINDKWYIVDAHQGAIRTDYRNYVIYDKGLDSWDIGIKSMDDLKSKFIDFREKYKNSQKS